jgi:hypothetical protein
LQVLSELEQLDEEARFENGVLSSFYWVFCVCVCAEWNICIETVQYLQKSHVKWTDQARRQSKVRFPQQFLKVIGSDFHASYS